MKPNFLYIGPDKSGSTWLYKILSMHPDCFIPPVKELFFFDRHYDKGMKWYHSFFKNAPDSAHVIGEFSHDYLFSVIAADRISRDLPDVRLLTFLRNPVDRAFSQYLYLIRSGYTRKPFEIALKEIPRIIDNGMYGKHLSVYYELFDCDQIGVFIFDDLKANPIAFAKQVFGFLGIDLIDEIPYKERVLGASKPKSPLAAKVVKKFAILTRDLGYPNIVGRIKSNSFIQNLLYQTYGEREKPVIASQTANYLRKVYSQDMELLSKLTNFDLNW